MTDYRSSLRAVLLAGGALVAAPVMAQQTSLDPTAATTANTRPANNTAEAAQNAAEPREPVWSQ